MERYVSIDEEAQKQLEDYFSEMYIANTKDNKPMTNAMFEEMLINVSQL